MEILRFLLSFFLKNQNGDLKIDELLQSFSNGANPMELLKNLNLDSIMPILESFLSFNNKERPPQTDRRSYGLEPVSLIADKDIVYALNLYFGNS